MYRLVNDIFTNQVSAIYRIADRAYIPLSEGNRDYQEYLAWVAEGNDPLPADETS